jgi:hypothetical protein
MKLFEIADRLAETAPPKGIIRSFGSLVADNTTRYIVGYMRSIHIYNAGAQDVYIWANEDEHREPWLEGDAPLAAGEDIDIDFKANKDNKVYYRCKPGVSTTIKGWQLF